MVSDAIISSADDQNRCRLSTIPGVEGSDYINASFVDVRSRSMNHAKYPSTYNRLCLHKSWYISSKFISLQQGYHKSRAFIATQGPLPDTKEDFWRLIWEQKSTTIVMLTKEKEAGKVELHIIIPHILLYNCRIIISC